MLQRDVLQFYERGWANAETAITVSPGFAAVAMPAVLERDDAEAPWVVGRLELWGAALRLIQTRPLLGVGPDNFRHLYGAQLGLETWDERVQANNLYLEVLADVGLLGLAAFLWVIAAPLLVARRLLTARFARSLSRDKESSNEEDLFYGEYSDTRRGAAQRRSAVDLLTARFARSLSRDKESSNEEDLSHREYSDTRRGAAPRRSAESGSGEAKAAIVLGVTAAIVAFLVHGLLDSFLAFTPTALLLWMLLGMLAAQKPQVSGR
jgi:O-antigen ligase